MKYKQYALFENATEIIMSLKENYLKNIIAGKKKYEYRFRFPKGKVKAYLYITSPAQKLAGILHLEAAVWMETEELLRHYQKEGGTAAKMADWLNMKSGCYVARIIEFQPFTHELSYDMLKKHFNFFPPQGWTYLGNNPLLRQFLHKYENTGGI